ncbi:hypothetical protein GOL30_32100 [Sinorhizobium medicae]|uniref:hypothetical protein n=1 Tax=Sinorhizobium medicae TaxID=110321 RepID=UPI001304EF0D|nr:hypothetical protein [Sinorhizobium medicae]MDX0433361.1 hypothetical protein [Sinorhizobium medicae]MDX1079199.1 hypothetical protein [Sinorhizobium medicae]MDX1109946.1 hypothetical protein [Sinorhizobium medicae]MDX1200501.1 hypothetical protein [Sinorhizobium medicae]
MAFELPPPRRHRAFVRTGESVTITEAGGEGSFSYRRSCRPFGGTDVSMTYQSHLRI